MELNLSATAIIYLVLYATIFSIAIWILALAVLFVIEKLSGNKQIINNLLKEKRDRDLAERGLKQELNKLIDDGKKFKSQFEPSPQSKQLDKYFERLQIN